MDSNPNRLHVGDRVAMDDDWDGYRFVFGSVTAEHSDGTHVYVTWDDGFQTVERAQEGPESPWHAASSYSYWQKNPKSF